MSQSWGQFHKQILEKAKKNMIPVTGQFELTSRCNLQCKMCYVCMPSNDKKIQEMELTAKQWIDLATQAKEAGMFYLLLTGGEVLIRPDFKEIYEEINKLGLQITIYTNGTMVTPEIASWLGKKPPEKMEITLYGASPETYAKVTGNADAFERALRGMDLLKSEGINLSLRTTVIKDNESDREKMVEIALQKDLLMRYVFYVSPRQDNSLQSCDSLRLSPTEMVDYSLTAGELYIKSLEIMREKHGIEKNSKDKEIIRSNSEIDEIGIDNSLYKPNNEESPFKCDAGKSDFWINSEGKMTPCILGGNIFTYPLVDGFKNAWSKLKDKCNSVPACNECMECDIRDYCITCPIRLYIETGSYEKKAPYLCRSANYRKSIMK